MIRGKKLQKIYSNGRFLPRVQYARVQQKIARREKRPGVGCVSPLVWLFTLPLQKRCDRHPHDFRRLAGLHVSERRFVHSPLRVPPSCLRRCSSRLHVSFKHLVWVPGCFLTIPSNSDSVCPILIFSRWLTPGGVDRTSKRQKRCSLTSPVHSFKSTARHNDVCLSQSVMEMASL